MRKRNLRRALAAGLALVLVAAAAVVLWPRPERVTRENFGRVRKGLSEAEVQAILGPYHSSGSRPDGRFMRAWFSSEDPPEWFGVSFDPSGVVEETFAGRAKESSWEIGSRRLGSRLKQLAGR